MTSRPPAPPTAARAAARGGRRDGSGPASGPPGAARAARPTRSLASPSRRRHASSAAVRWSARARDDGRQERRHAVLRQLRRQLVDPVRLAGEVDPVGPVELQVDEPRDDPATGAASIDAVSTGPRPMAVIRPPSITTWPSSRTPSGVITEPLVTAMVGWPTPTLYPYPGARDDDGADVHRDPRHRPRPVGRHRRRSCRPRRRDHGDLPRARLLPRGRPRRARLVPPRVGRRAAGVLRPARGRQGEHRQDRVAALPGLGAGRGGADGPPHGLPRAARRGHREPAVRARRRAGLPPTRRSEPVAPRVAAARVPPPRQRVPVAHG